MYVRSERRAKRSNIQIEQTEFAPLQISTYTNKKIKDNSQMKKSTPPLERHRDCQVEVRSSSKAQHLAYYYCLDCHKHVAWISRNDLNQLEQLNLIKIDT